MRLLPVIRLDMLGFTVVQGLDEGGNKHLGLGSYQENFDLLEGSIDGNIF